MDFSVGPLARYASGVQFGAGVQNLVFARQVFVGSAAGAFGTLADAITYVTSQSPSASAPWIIHLLPGVHVVSSALTLPAWCSLHGSGQDCTLIDFTVNYSTLNVASHQTHRGYSMRCARTSAASSPGMFRLGTSGTREIFVEDCSFYHRSAYQQAISIAGYCTISMRNITIWTQSIGIQATGYIYLDNPRIILYGNNTGTPYYGITFQTGSTADARYYINGGFIGTGYNAADASGWLGDDGLDITSDPDVDIIGIHCPSTHTPTVSTGSRIQLQGTEMYVRNPAQTSLTYKSRCVNIEGECHVRAFGGVYQTETPSVASGEDYAIYVDPSTNSIAELYGVRARTFGGAATGGVATEGARVLTADETLENNMGGTVLVDATAAARAITLQPTTATASPPAGMRVRIIKTDSSGNAVTVNAGTGNTIEGSSSISLASQYDNAELVYGEHRSGVWYRID